MKRRTVVIAIGGAVVLGVAASITIDNSGFYPLMPGSNQLVKSARPSRSMISANQAIRDARRYAGRQWNPREPIATAYGIVKSPRYYGPAWLVTDPYAFVPSTGPNPQRTDTKTGFLTRRSLTVVINARTGHPVEAFAPAGPYHRTN